MKSLRLKIKMFTVAAALFGVAGLISSCSSGRKATKSTNQTRVVVTDGEVSEPRKAFEAMVASYAPQWTKLKMPVTVNLSSPMQAGASGVLTMERGRSIQISMRVLGMEVASLFLTPDTVTVIDRWNKRYVREGLTRFLAGFPVDINNVQDLLTGRLFLAGHPELNTGLTDKFKFESDGQLWGCQPVEQAGSYSYLFMAMATNLMRFEAEAGSGGATIEYADPQLTPYGPMAAGLTVSSMAGKKKIEAQLSYKIAKASWDDNVTIADFTPPRGYRRIDAAGVLKGLSAK